MRNPSPSRRTFLMHGAAAVAASAVALDLTDGRPRRRQRHDQGRPGRLRRPGHRRGRAGADGRQRHAKLVAMADAFQDRLEGSLAEPQGLADRPPGSTCPKDRQYSGFDAYKNVIDQVDVVLLTTPPHFRPIHLAYAVEKGVHAFVEKPMAVDAPGLREVHPGRARTPRPRTCRSSTASAGAITARAARP